jgi:hypothetical protein
MIIDLLIFVLLQGLSANGIYLSMEDGMILNGYKAWLKKRPSWVGKPFGLCIKCMASSVGTVTFWPTCLFIYGWHPMEIFVWIMDLFLLVSVNWYIYKKM